MALFARFDFSRTPWSQKAKPTNIGVIILLDNRHYRAAQTGDSSGLKPLYMCRYVRLVRL